MKLSVIEVDGHPECLRALCRVLEASSVRATIYTRASIWRQVGLQPFEFSGELRLLSDSGSLPKFFRKLRDEINQSNLVLFNTLASHFDFFADFNLIPPTVIRVHNANTFGRPWASYRPFSDPGVRWRDLPKIARNSLRAADRRALGKVLARAAFLTFPNATITEHVLRERMFDESKVLRNPIQFAYKEFRERPNRDFESVSIAVPGAISPRRRNYDMLIGAFRRAFPRLECSVELALLGSAKSGYARDVVDRLRSFESDAFRLIAFDSFVANEVFEGQMDKTDFLILPISPVMCHKRIFLEEYGSTKASGSIDDMVRFGLPAMLPTSYPLADELRGIAGFYDNESKLADLIVDWVNTRSFKNLDTASSLSSYSLSQVTKSLEQTLTGLLAGTPEPHNPSHIAASDQN